MGADYYHHPIGDVLFHALPILLARGGLRRTRRCGTGLPLNKAGGGSEQPETFAKATTGTGGMRQGKIWRDQVATLEFNDAAYRRCAKKVCVI